MDTATGTNAYYEGTESYQPDLYFIIESLDDSLVDSSDDQSPNELMESSHWSGSERTYVGSMSSPGTIVTGSIDDHADWMNGYAHTTTTITADPNGPEYQGPGIRVQTEVNVTSNEILPWEVESGQTHLQREVVFDLTEALKLGDDRYWVFAYRRGTVDGPKHREVIYVDHRLDSAKQFHPFARKKLTREIPKSQVCLLTFNSNYIVSSQMLQFIGNFNDLLNAPPLRHAVTNMAWRADPFMDFGAAGYRYLIANPATVKYANNDRSVKGKSKHVQVLPEELSSVDGDYENDDAEKHDVCEGAVEDESANEGGVGIA